MFMEKSRAIGAPYRGPALGKLFGEQVFGEWTMAYNRPDDENVKQFNLVLLFEFSERSSGSLLSF